MRTALGFLKALITTLQLKMVEALQSLVYETHSQERNLCC